MLGVVVNAVAILLGGLVGLLLKKGIPERFSGAVMTGIGLCVAFIGIQGALEGENPIVLIISIVLGVTVGTALQIDRRLHSLGQKIEAKLSPAALPDESAGESKPKIPIAQGFVTGSLLYCIGAMAIVGAINSGLTGDHSVLFTKSIIDMISSIVLAATLGVGILLSAVTVFLYQGTLVLLAQLLGPLLENESVIAELTSVGSVIIIALGLNLIGVTKIKIADFLPAILFAPVVFMIVNLF